MSRYIKEAAGKRKPLTQPHVPCYCGVFFYTKDKIPKKRQSLLKTPETQVSLWLTRELGRDEMGTVSQKKQGNPGPIPQFTSLNIL